MSPSHIVVYLLLIVLVSVFGSLFPLFRKLKKWHLRMGISFGAGTLLSTAFLHILPKVAAALGEDVGVPILAGFLTLYVLEKFVMIHPCEEGDCGFHKIGPGAFWGISFHSFVDGITLGASMSFPPLALPVFLAIATHKVPAAISLSTILIFDGSYPRAKIIKLALLFSLSAPMGVLCSWRVFGGVSEHLLFVTLGFSMGTFLTIAISDLLPLVHKGDWSEKGWNMAALFFGVFIIWAGKTAFVH